MKYFRFFISKECTVIAMLSDPLIFLFSFLSKLVV